MVCILLARVPHFNSQPHKEADEQDVCCEYDRVISTHSLTRRLTSVSRETFRHFEISTHSLTRRLTKTIFSTRPYSAISTHSLTRRLTCGKWYE